MLALDSLATGKRENLNPAAGFAEVDLRDGDLDAVLGDFRPDVVVHEAAQASVPASVHDPVYDANVNVVGTVRLLEAARKCGTRKVIYAATGGAMYGTPQYLPIDERHPVEPMSPYAASKAAAEQYLRVYQSLYGLSYTSLRYANIYGPRQDPSGEAGVIAIFTNKMLAGQQPIVNGPGTDQRDYVYVGDVARANVLALDRADNAAVNVGDRRRDRRQHALRPAQGADRVRRRAGPRSAPRRRRAEHAARPDPGRPAARLAGRDRRSTTGCAARSNGSSPALADGQPARPAEPRPPARARAARRPAARPRRRGRAPRARGRARGRAGRRRGAGRRRAGAPDRRRRRRGRPAAPARPRQRDRRHHPDQPRPRAVSAAPPPRRWPRSRPATPTSSTTSTRGERGSRTAHLEPLLAELTGAEAALAVNNNAAALLLALSRAGARARGRHLARPAVEIGGGFRIPDVMRQSGADAGRGRHDQPHLRARLRRGDRRPHGRAAARPRQQLPRRRLHPRAGAGRAGRARARSAACSCSTTSAAGTLLDTAALRPGATSRPCRRASRPAPTWSASAATSCSAARRPASWSAGGRADRPAASATRWPARVRLDKATHGRPGGDAAGTTCRGEATSEIPVWRMIAAPLEALERARRAAGPRRWPAGDARGGRRAVALGRRRRLAAGRDAADLRRWPCARATDRPTTLAARLRRARPAAGRAHRARAGPARPAHGPARPGHDRQRASPIIGSRYQLLMSERLPQDPHLRPAPRRRRRPDASR